MDPSAVAAIVAAVGAVAAAAGALAAVPFTRRAANAAKDQTDLQRELERERAQPYVWADIQPDAKQGTMIQIIVGNAGPTVASNVRVLIDPPLPAPARYRGHGEAAQRRLASGIRSLAPGRRIEWAAGMAFDMIDDEDRVHTIRVTADGPHGPITPLQFDVDLADWGESRDAPDGSLHLIRGAVQDLAREVSAFREAFQRITPTAKPSPSIEVTTARDSINRKMPGQAESEDG